MGIECNLERLRFTRRRSNNPGCGFVALPTAIQNARDQQPNGQSVTHVWISHIDAHGGFQRMGESYN